MYSILYALCVRTHYTRNLVLCVTTNTRPSSRAEIPGLVESLVADHILL